MYDEAMHRIYSQPTEDVALAKGVLSWISCAKRPLKVLELQHALAVEPGAMGIDEEALTEEDFLVSVCAGLVTIEKESNIIRLVHFTTQEYLERTRINHFHTAEIDIAMSCLTYLSFDGYIELAYMRFKRDLSRDRYALLSYVTTYWVAHILGEPEKDPQIQRLALQLLENNRKVTLLHGIQRSLRSRLDAHPYPKHVVEGLSLAASCGLITITALLLDRGAHIENTSLQNGERPLHRAARYGHGAVVKLLLEKGAQRDVRTWNDEEPALMLAAESGHELVVKVLLDSGAAIEARNLKDATPLNFAVSFHNTAVAALLLESGADINTKDAQGLTPISMASRERNGIAMLQLLLERGVDLSTRSVHNSTPLGDAAYNSSSDVVRLLLEAGAGVNARDGLDNGTALFSAMSSGKSDKVQLLLDAGIDIHMRNDEGKTALFRGKNVDTIRLLLDAGADVKAVDRSGMTTLMAVAGRSGPTVVQFLINKGVDVNVKDINGKTALLTAARRGGVAVMQHLIDAGADVNTKDNRGRTALIVAVEKGDAAAVQLLLELGADVNMKDNYGQTALWTAAKTGSETIVQLLLEKGADVHTKNDYDEWTALHAAVSEKWRGSRLSQDNIIPRAFIAHALLKAGADIEARDRRGRRVLPVAAKRSGTKAVQFLLDAGAAREG